MTVEHQMSPLPLGTPSLMVGFKLMVQHDESLQVFHATVGRSNDV